MCKLIRNLLTCFILQVIITNFLNFRMLLYFKLNITNQIELEDTHNS